MPTLTIFHFQTIDLNYMLFFMEPVFLNCVLMFRECVINICHRIWLKLYSVSIYCPFSLKVCCQKYFSASKSLKGEEERAKQTKRNLLKNWIHTSKRKVICPIVLFFDGRIKNSQNKNKLNFYFINFTKC